MRERESEMRGVRVCDEVVWWMCDLRHRFGAILGSFLQTRGSSHAKRR